MKEQSIRKQSTIIYSDKVEKPQEHLSDFVATDSEWDTSLSSPWLSTSFAFPDGRKVLFVREDAPHNERMEVACRDVQCELRYIRRTDKTDLLSELGVKSCRLAMYFSPKDVEYAVGWERWQKAMLDGKVNQRNNLSGRLGKVYVKDVFGLAGKRGLVKLAATVGVSMPDKGSLDEYKSCMWKAMVEKPEDFIRYAVGDAVALLAVLQSFLGMFTIIQRECLEMEEADCWTAKDMPMTIGALVAKSFERWLYSRAGDYKEAMKFSVRKLGLLDPDAKTYRQSKIAYEKVVYRCDAYYLPEDLKHRVFNPELKSFSEAKYLFAGLDGCSVKWWASRPTTETSCFNALVHGGRCNNENPNEYAMGAGEDIDISGCYGESLRSLTYPVGLPTVWSWNTNEKRPTLGEWLDANESDLVDGLWQCVVCGRLDYEQDLIYSKLVKAKDIRKAAMDFGEDADIAADFVLLRREITNGVITSDVLNSVRKVASDVEWAGLRRLTVLTACGYLRKDRCADVGDWCERIMSSGGSHGRLRASPGTTEDKRSRAWYGVPLEDFIGRLVDERIKYKSVSKDTVKSEEERTRADGLQEMLKLLVNTLYGDVASRYFPIGNVVLGNNITARARVGVWQVAKALGLRQCITDGGFYDPAKVCVFDDAYRKPGLDILSRQWEWHAPNRRRWFKPLAVGNDMDKVATNHVRDFWKPYGLDLAFKLEHKTKNKFSRAAYWSKGDYALLTETGLTYAIRGKDLRSKDKNPHPTFELLANIVVGKVLFPADLTYTRSGLLKIGKWRIVQKSNGYENLHDLRPGDDLPETTYTARYNNTHFPIQDEADYRRRRCRKKIDHGKPVAWFERFADGGISSVHGAMFRNKMRKDYG
jgi:hypothetical protein